MFWSKPIADIEGICKINEKKEAFKRVSEIIQSSEKELFINSNYYLKIFESELAEAKRRGVRIVLFSFNEPEKVDVEIEITKRGLPRGEDYDRHLWIVADHSIALMYQEYILQKRVEAIIVKEPMLVRLIAEQIHNDIYFQRIKYLIGGMDIISKVTIKSSYEL